MMKKLFVVLVVVILGLGGGSIQGMAQGAPAPTTGTGGGAPAPTGPTTITFTNPVGFTTVEDFLTQGVFKWLQGIIVTLALIVLVIGGIMYILSVGDTSKIEKAKAAIVAALIGLAIALAAPTMLKEIYGILGGTAPGALAGPTLVQILLRVLNFLLSIVGILAIIMLVIGGLTYITAAGDENQIDTGRSIVKWSIIGVAVATASLVLISQVTIFFR